MKRTSALLAGLLLPIVVATTISAHGPDNWYPAKWKVSGFQDRNVEWRFDREFPYGGGIRRAVKAGARAWNRLDEGMSFDFHSNDWNGFNPRSCPNRYQKDGVHWGPIDGPGGTLAYTFVCSTTDGGGDPDAVLSFQMEFDSQESWHRDPRSDPMLLQTDVRGVATHEFGHATGRIAGGPDDQGHFDESSSLCPDVLRSDRHTMCPSTSGSGYGRSLEKHDKHVFRYAY